MTNMEAELLEKIAALKLELFELKERTERSTNITLLALADTDAVGSLMKSQLIAVRAERDAQSSTFSELVSNLRSDLLLANARIAELQNKLPDPPSVADINSDPSSSFWLLEALAKALNRDPVDAANDAEVLAAVLRRRVREAL